MFAPIIAPYGPNEILTDPAANERNLESPCVHLFGCPDSDVQHLMGLDENGRDELSRVVFGARISLLAGAASVVLAVVVGTVIGLVAGFFGRRLDNVLMRCMDVLLSFPSLLLAILIVTVLGRGLINSVLAIAIVSVPAYARVVRGQVLSVREQDFITADRALGVRNRRLLTHRVFPNTLTPLVVQSTLGFATAVLEIAGLGFLGLGVQPPDAEWGTMISAAYRNIFNAPHLVFFPGLMIFLNVLAFNLLGDALRAHAAEAGARPASERQRVGWRWSGAARDGARRANDGSVVGIDAEALGPAAEVTATVSEAPPETTPPLLEVADLRTWFKTRAGEVHAVDGVDLTVRRGEVLGLVGESGSGKSVTMLSVMRLVDQPGRIVSGSVTFDGIDVLALPRNEMRSLRGDRISMIFQQPNASLHPCFTAGVQISEVYEIHRNSRRSAGLDKAVEMLHTVGIPDARRRAKSYPHQLSGGQAQRVMIAMALAAAPELLIADEPTTALDVTIQAQILDLMRALQAERGTSMVLITHDLGVVAEMAHRVAVMYGGQIVEDAPVETLFTDPKHPYTRGLLGSIPVIGVRHEELTVISGRVPTLVDPPPGCRFADRCPDRMERCTQATPALVELDDGTHVRCFLHSDETVEEAPQLRSPATQAAGRRSVASAPSLASDDAS